VVATFAFVTFEDVWLAARTFVAATDRARATVGALGPAALASFSGWILIDLLTTGPRKEETSGKPLIIT
jgi:hypothetical protein